MKRRLFSLLALCLAAALIFGCGSQKDVSASVSASAAAAESTQASDAVLSAASSEAAVTEGAVQTEESPASQAAEESIPEDGNTEAGEESVPKEEITILYTNDVHSYICNEVTDQNKNKMPGLRYSTVAAMKKDLQAEGKNVLLVDAGDEIQGCIYGAMDKGETVIRLMNEAGYDLAVPGNHEFDYQITDFFDRVGDAAFPYLSCSFITLPEKEQVLEGTKIFDFNGTKVAFVGISTPETLSSTSPDKFRNEQGEFIYTFSGSGSVQELYDSVQQAVDSVRSEADFVIAVGHLGENAESVENGVAGISVIENTEGIDAFIDGHSHTVIEHEVVKNRNGEDVVLTQTGCYFSAIGVMTLGTDGTVRTELVREYENRDAELAAEEEAVYQKVNEEMGQKIAVLGTKMYVTAEDDPEQRVVRARETNLGDLVADAFYWYINETAELSCDAVIQNGGGVRAEMAPGDITYLDAKNVCPFGNQICLIEVTGAELLDILENGASQVGLWDDEWNAPAENGSFMHVAGLRYTIDASVPSSVVLDENGQFVSVQGEYRVKELEIYDREQGAYVAVDPEKTYHLGGINYNLRNSGSGLGFLSGNSCIADYIGPDVDLFVEYLKNFRGENGWPVISSENSPLASLDNYMLNYEDPAGAGRIRQINIPY